MRLGHAPVAPRRAATRQLRVHVSAGPSTLAKVVLSLHKPLRYGENVCISGSSPTLGSWDVKSAVKLQWNDGDVWSAALELPAG